MGLFLSTCSVPAVSSCASVCDFVCFSPVLLQDCSHPGRQLPSRWQCELVLTCKHSPSRGVPGICSPICTQKSWVGLFFCIYFCFSICFLLLWKLTCAPGNLVGAVVLRRRAGVHPGWLGREGLWETLGCDMSHQNVVTAPSGL